MQTVMLTRRAKRGRGVLTLQLLQGIVDDNLVEVNAALTAGADVGFSENEALSLAVRRGNVAIAERLLAAGADPNDSRGLFLADAVFSANADLVDLLLANGADVHSRDEQALFYAVQGGHRAIALRLLECGADTQRVLERLQEKQQLHIPAAAQAISDQELSPGVER